MKTAAITTYGDSDVFTTLDAPAPKPGPGETLVAVVASTINPVDVKTRTPGTQQQVGRFPAVLGWDVAGIVVTAPDDSEWVPGDRVIAMYPRAELQVIDGAGHQSNAQAPERLSAALNEFLLRTA